MSIQSPDIIVVRHHDPADQAAIGQLLDAYNISRVHQEERPPLAVLIKDSVGMTIGGLWGHFAYDWFFVAMLIVPEHLRAAGTGRRLMETAEQVAISENCLGIWLDTFEFQAAGFYKKLGFSQFGVIEDHPRGQSRLFFKKRFET
jgi:GNAT superfamily N-acetyltransferase